MGKFQRNAYEQTRWQKRKLESNIRACHVNAKCNKLDASICTIHCHCEHVKPYLVFNIFLELTFTATRDSCYQLDVEKSWQKRKLESNIYLHAMWTQNATNSTPLYARSTATVNMSNHVGFQHFPGVDCYSHQGQLLPAGCWKELTETKTWIKHTYMPCERKMQQTRRLYMHDPLPLWTCQTMLVFNIFLV